MSKKSSAIISAYPVRLKVAAVAFTILIGLTLLGPAMTMLGTSETGAGNSARQMGYLFVLVLATFSVRPIRHPERLLIIPIPIIIALGWCFLSLTWSIDPSVGARRLGLTSIIIATVFLLISALGTRRTLLMTRVALLAVLVANFAASIFFPKIGIVTPGKDVSDALVGLWKGVMADKNVAGLISAITILYFVHDRRDFSVTFCAVTVLFSSLFLLLSDSKTSIGLVLISAAAGLIMVRYSTVAVRRVNSFRRFRVIIPFVMLGLFVAVIHFGVQSDMMLAFVSDPSGLTGRTSIWNPLIRYYLENPLTGAGYGSFWNISTRSPIFSLTDGWVTTIAQGHNGYLDLLVTIGLPGLALVIAAVLIWPTKELFKFRMNSSFRNKGLVCATVLFCLAHNGTESSLFDRDTIGEVFLMLSLAMLYSGEQRFDDGSSEGSTRRPSVSGPKPINENHLSNIHDRRRTEPTSNRKARVRRRSKGDDLL